MKLLRIREALLLAGVLLQAAVCEAQQALPTRRIGIISSTGRLADRSPTREVFQQELRSCGYEQGTSVVIDERNAAGSSDRLPALLSELIALKVDVIVAADTTAAVAAKRATQTIPVVFMAADPIGNQLVTDLRRPGGNLTGVAFIADRQNKQIEIMGK
jgi:putative ABC transport system substrate-binding protein